MKRMIKIWGSRVLVLAVLAAAVNYWGIPLYKKYAVKKEEKVFIPTTKVQQGEFVISFHELGTLEAKNSVVVVSEVNGKIISILKDGTMIAAGDEIALLDTSELERQVRNQEMEYDNKKVELERVRSELEIYKKSNETKLKQSESQLEYNRNELTLAEEDLEKKKRLAEEKLVPGSEVQRAEGVVRSKKLEVEKGEANYELEKEKIASEESQKEAGVKNKEFGVQIFKSNLEQSQKQLINARILAPTSGIVVLNKTWDMGAGGRRPIQAGDMVHRRMRICSLPDLSEMIAKVNVGEKDAPKLSKGLPVLIKLDAVPDKVFHGKVAEISMLATERRIWEGGTPGKKNFDIIINVQEKDVSTLKPGITADVEFICETLEDTIYVPIEAVDEKDGKTYVFVQKGDKYERTYVTVGKMNDNFVQIKKGLKKGQVVALRDPTRPLEQQEAGSSAPGADKEKKKNSVPIPGEE